VTAASKLTIKPSDPGHRKLGSAPHCRVLPPGEFNGIIPEPLSV